MKYSLANKQPKKRNTIFGDRKNQQHQPTQDQRAQRLDEIRQMGQDLEDSNFNQLKSSPKQSRHTKIYQVINFSGVADNQRISSVGHKNNQVKHGRHGLSPNLKPSIPKIASLINHRVQNDPLLAKREKLKFENHINEFTYFQNKIQNELKSLILKLYQLLLHNNQRINTVQKVVAGLIKTGHTAIRQINCQLFRLCKFQTKIDLFFNTIRSVYEGLRIAKLKQQNLQLYLKQFVFSTHSRSNHTKRQTMGVHSSIKVAESQESRQLINLIDYESESSDNQIAQKNIKINNPFVKIKTLQNQQGSNSKRLLGSQSVSKQTFRPEASHYEKLSPFQANQYICQSKFVQQLDMHSMPVSSGQDYSFHDSSTQYKKIRNLLQKSGYHGMHCRLDEMGCLRRPNGTYIFNPRGEVLSMSKPVFFRLCEEGYLKRHSTVQNHRDF